MSPKSNRKAMVEMPLIFLLVLASVSAALFTIYYTQTTQNEILTKAEMDNVVKITWGALTKLPECFAYEENGIVQEGIFDQAKIDDGDNRLDCAGFGPSLWRLEFVTYTLAPSPADSRVEGNVEFIPLVPVQTVSYAVGPSFEPITSQKFTIPVHDGQVISNKEVVLAIGSRSVDLNVEQKPNQIFVVQLKQHTLFEGPRLFLFEAEIINLTDYKQNCGALKTSDNIYYNGVKEQITATEAKVTGSVSRKSTMAATPGMPLEFWVRNRDDPEQLYKGQLAGCGLRITASLDGYEKVYEVSEVIELK